MKAGERISRCGHFVCVLRGSAVILVKRIRCVPMLHVPPMRSSYLSTERECKGKLRNMKVVQRNLLNTAEFAAALGLSPKTIRQRAWKRSVPFVRIVGAIRFRPETVDEIVSRGSVPASGARH